MKNILFSRTARVTSVVLAFLLIMVMLPVHSSAGSVGLLYDSIPAVMPGGFTSLGYQATSTDEFGDHIQFALSGKVLDTVTVSMTNWACGNDFKKVDGAWVKDRASSTPCATTPGDGFDHDLTLNFYTVDTTSGVPQPGTLIDSKTITALMYYRPSADADNCPGTDKWYSQADAACYNGYAFNVDFDFSGENLVLPDEIIFGLAYNTQTHGATPLGVAGPYNSLNFSLANVAVAPTTGTNLDPDDAFWDTTYPGYSDTFLRDTDWSPYTPVIRFTTVLDETGPVTSSVVVSPDPVILNSDQPVEITATVDDTDNGGANIASAEVRLAGSDTWLPLDAQDGDFDTVSEAVTGSYTPAELGLTGSSANLCVRGTDALGNTGEESCAEVQLRVLIFLPYIAVMP
jgi:hypothetical protein